MYLNEQPIDNYVINANYSSSTFTVRFINGDGALHDTKTNITYGTKFSDVRSGVTDPTKTATAEYTYTFKNWSLNDDDVITGDTDVTSEFDSTINQYTITFKNDGDTQLQSSEWNYGETPTYSCDTPTSESTLPGTRSFSGWTPNITTVTGDATYTATYTTKYTVNYYKHRGGVSAGDSEQVTRGTLCNNVPTMTDTQWSFDHWTNGVDGQTFNPSTDKIYGDTNLYAVWKYAGVEAIEFPKKALSGQKMYHMLDLVIMNGGAQVYCSGRVKGNHFADPETHTMTVYVVVSSIKIDGDRSMGQFVSQEEMEGFECDLTPTTLTNNNTTGTFKITSIEYDKDNICAAAWTFTSTASFTLS